MNNLQLTDEQVKVLLILTGQCAGAGGAHGIYEKLCDIIRPDPSSIPSPKITVAGTIIVYKDMLDQIVSMEI